MKAVILTGHAMRRIQQRAGIQNGYVMRFATKAFHKGTPAGSYKYHDFRWCQRKEYKGFYFIFKGNVCLTMWRKE